MATPLATIDDLNRRLKSALSSSETARAESVLGDVSASVRRHTGQDFTQATTTDRLRVRRGKVRLPQWPVTAVTSVADTNANSVLFSWVADDVVTLSQNLDSFSFEPWSNGFTHVDVTYTHGYATLPDDLVGIVCQIAARVMGAPPEQSGKQSEEIGDYSYTLGAAAAAGPVGLLPAEREALSAFRRPGSPVFALV